MNPDPACAEALDWLYSTQLFGIKLGLEGTTRLLKACGQLMPRARVIHVAGTNGKGSTCAFAESIARSAGYSTGLFTSPHLVDFSERIRTNGAPITPEATARLINKVRGIIEDWEQKPTFFEIVLAVALLYFSEQEVDIIILETGLGGRLDATNAVPKDVAVLTSIGMDHAQYLGSTLAEVAAEKAAIFAWHRPALTAPQPPECMPAIEASAREHDVDYRIVPADCDYPLGLAGRHQRQNASLAIAALRAIPHFICSEDELARGLANVQWPGRFQEIAPGVILDGAHNPPAMKVLVNCWREHFGEQKARCIFACSADKALPEIIRLLSPIVGEWILPPVDSPRILPPAELAPLVREQSSAPLRVAGTLAEPLESPAPGTLICGSFFLLGAVMAHLRQAPYRPTAQ